MAATMTQPTDVADPVAERVERLNTASLRRVIEPEERFAWDEMTDGQLIPDALLSIDPDEYGLTPEQRATLSREEVASLLQPPIPDPGLARHTGSGISPRPDAIVIHMNPCLTQGCDEQVSESPRT